MNKSLLLIAGATMLSLSAFAQPWAFTTLDINQAKAGVNSNGDLFWNYSSAQFEVPQDSGRHTMGASALWIGGLDAGSNLHLAAQTYRQTGSDFFPGPIMSPASYSSANDALWNRLWKINKTTIDTFLLWRANPASVPGYVIPNVIATWPGNGDVAQGQSQQLAAYVDADGDGVYSPANGDYPCIKGDQAVFFLFNDGRNVHTETSGAQLGVEVHGMLFAYSAPGSWLDSTVFLNYNIYNRSTATYTDVYLGSFTDFEIGAYYDDYVGCDAMRAMVFGYNADADDGSSPIPGPGTYGANPPAQGVLYLNGPVADASDGVDNNRDGIVDEPGETCIMNYHVSYNNDFTSTGNPVTTSEYYGYLSGLWKDNSPWTYGGNGYGGSVACDWMYPGASDPLGIGTNNVPQPAWDEVTAGNTPGDRRSLGSSGPFTLSAGENNCVDYAYVYGRGSNGPSSSLAAMEVAADSARAFYVTNNPCTCDENPLAVAEQQNSIAGIYPNPASESVNIICGSNATGSIVEIIDANGKLVSSTTVLSGNSTMVDISGFAPGIYFVRVNKGSVVLTGRFMKN